MSDINDPTEETKRDETATAYVVADADGRIVLTGVVPAFMLADQTPPAGGALVQGIADITGDWVTAGAIAARPANPAVLNGTVLTALPNPSTVTINGVAYTVTDGELDMTFPNAGTYAITVSSPFPYLDAAFTHTQ